jgi:hypothetical protein
MRGLVPITVSLALVGLAAPALAGQLSETDAKKVLSEHGDEVRSCYMKHGFAQRGATGKVTVVMVVEKTGDTRDVQVDAPGVKGKQLTRCVAAAVSTWSFPAIDSATEVEFPFLFQHTSRAKPARSTRRASR